MTLAEAIARFVQDGDTLVAEGFTHLIPFAAGHEIIRQRKKDLVLCRLTPDLIFDQMLAAGVARKIVFSWAGNPGVGSLHGFRRAVEQRIPRTVEIEEYSHFGMVARMMAGAARLPFMPLRSYQGTDLPRVNPLIRPVRCPFTNEELYAVPALNADVAILHVQRADAHGNAQVWGLVGVQKESAFASRRVIVIAEEIVDGEVIRSDPNRTLIPGLIVNAVVHEPWGAHPSYAQGFYDRDNDFYVAWDEMTRTPQGMNRYLEEWVYGVSGRAEYIEKLGQPGLARLRVEPAPAPPIDYGRYR